MMVDECSCFFTVYIFCSLYVNCMIHRCTKKALTPFFLINSMYLHIACIFFMHSVHCVNCFQFFFCCISLLICLYSRRMLEFNLFKQHIWILADDGSCIHSVRYMLDKCFKSLDYARVLDILCTIFRVSSSLLV